MIPPCPAPVRILAPQLKLPMLLITLLKFEGVRIFALVDAHKDIVSLSSATEGTLLELLAAAPVPKITPLLHIDLQFRFLLSLYSSATSESAI
jgi:hypothetical protein